MLTIHRLKYNNGSHYSVHLFVDLSSSIFFLLGDGSVHGGTAGRCDAIRLLSRNCGSYTH